MAGAESKSFSSPDETREFKGKGRAEVLVVNGRTVSKATFEPGWKWSVNLRPIAQTDSCQVEHFGYVLSGRMRVVMDDGMQFEVGPDDLFALPPGHDAEVIGDETCVLVDFGQVQSYAKPPGP
ncbi:cupin domain-containing protein [Georgenia daeguensis]|uniref:Cupin domain-containing protein n=2 Tax=Georgenia daeguensis TaxID=908355 RepID=A0ABP8EWG5_9MICO